MTLEKPGIVTIHYTQLPSSRYKCSVLLLCCRRPFGSIDFLSEFAPTTVSVVNIGRKHFPDPVRRLNLLVKIDEKIQICFVASGLA